nr:MAG TPA: hypothetical protein [Caudoviricetes sp.]
MLFLISHSIDLPLILFPYKPVLEALGIAAL